jgi:AmiR/NasT family two-component response regulator
MAGEKYIVAADNSLQITIRNILSPNGYTYLAHCSDATNLIRFVRTMGPDFIVVDTELQQSDMRSALETIDGEMLCASILLNDCKDAGILAMLEKSNAMCYCPKPPTNRDMLLQTVDMALMNYRRISSLGRKLREVTQDYESRVLIEHAKRILMNKYGYSENEAYQYIRKKSMDGRMKINTVAEAIINTYEIMRKG